MKPPAPSSQPTLLPARAEDFVEKPTIHDPRQLDLVRAAEKARRAEVAAAKPGKPVR
jgi:hypothetical protein